MNPQTYSVKNTETGDITQMTHEQVQSIITKLFQGDMGGVFGEGKTDEEIAADVAGSMYATFDAVDYEITKNA